MTDYTAALSALYPDASWSLNANDFSTLDWQSHGRKPTQEELDAAWPQVQYDLAYAQVQADRHAAYVTDADPVFFRWQRGQATEQEWLDACVAVDASHPYPPGP